MQSVQPAAVGHPEGTSALGLARAGLIDRSLDWQLKRRDSCTFRPKEFASRCGVVWPRRLTFHRKGEVRPLVSSHRNGVPIGPWINTTRQANQCPLQLGEIPIRFKGEAKGVGSWGWKKSVHVNWPARRNEAQILVILCWSIEVRNRYAHGSGGELFSLKTIGPPIRSMSRHVHDRREGASPLRQLTPVLRASARNGYRLARACRCDQRNERYDTNFLQWPRPGI